MEDKSITIIFHSGCKASVDFCSLVKKLTNYTLDFIDLQTDELDSEIETDVDIVPLICIDNKKSEIYKGKNAFDKIQSLIETNNRKETRGIYGSSVTFIEDTKQKKEHIDLDAAKKNKT
jgi:hypothetical protein